MAIILNTTPPAYTSVNGDIIFVAYEATRANDPITYPNYKYVCDVYIDSNLVTRLKAFPDPTNKRGVFNIGQIVRSYVEATFNPTANALVAQELAEGEFSITVQCKFGEEVDLVLTSNLTVDSARVYFNHYNGRLNGVVTTILADFADKPTTSRPAQTSVFLAAGEVFIPYFATTTTPFDVVVTLNDATTDTLTVTPTAANSIEQLNVSPAVLNAVSSLTIDETTTYYTVSFNGENYRFNLACEAKYELHTLHFLNKYGGFESYTFSKVNRKSEEIERKSFGKLAYTIDSSGVASTYSANKVYNETKSTYSTTFTEKLILNSDLLNDGLYQWLGELIKSPLIYLQEGEYFTPVSISQNNYDYRKTINDRLTNLRIELEFGNVNNTQFR